MDREPEALEPGGEADVERDAHRLRNGVIWTAVLLLLLLAIGLAIPDLRTVLRRAAHADIGWLVLGVGLELASCLGYVMTVRLVLHRGPKGLVRQLAWAEMAFGAVVPVGGAGGLAVGAWAMRARGIDWTRIANRSAVIFLLTSAVNGFVLIVAGLGVTLGVGIDHVHVIYGILPLVISVAIVVAVMALPGIQRLLGRSPRSGRFVRVVNSAADWIRDTEAIAFQPNWRLLGPVGYLLFDIAVLWACLKSVGLTAPIVPLIAGYQVGYLANLIPIPGGVGVLEGGLLGALLLYGLPAEPTAAAVIIYHAIALWVPTLGGTYAFTRMRRALAEGHHAPPSELAEGAQPGVTDAAQASDGAGLGTPQARAAR